MKYLRASGVRRVQATVGGDLESALNLAYSHLKLVAEGTPEQIAQTAGLYIGQSLREIGKYCSF